MKIVVFTLLRATHHVRSCCFQDLLNQIHIRVFALMGVMKNDHDIPFGHAGMLAGHIDLCPSQTLKDKLWRTIYC